MVSQAGSDQVMNTIKGFAGNGMIGYVEYSYPINADYPVVKVENKAGYFVEPTQYNTAVALTKAKINQDKSSQLYLTQILDGVYTNPDPRAYPISSYSYMIIPTGADDPRMTTAKRQTLADFMYYSLCAGQTKAGPVRLLAAAAQPGAGRLRAARQAEDGRPEGRPHRPRRALVQQPDLRRQEPQPERARRQRAAARRLRQGRRGPVRHRDRHQQAAAPTTAPATAARRHRRRRRPAPAAADRRPTGDGARAATRRRRVDPETGAVDDRRRDAPRRRPRRRDLRRTRPSWPPAAPSDEQDLRLAGRRSSCSRWCWCPACTSCRCGAAAADGAALVSRRLRRYALRSRRARGRLAPGRLAGRAPRPASAAGADRRGGAGRTGRQAPPATPGARPRTFARDVRQRRRPTTLNNPLTGAPYKVTVKVDHTQNLRGRERVEITWTGAQPSAGRATDPYGATA